MARMICNVLVALAQLVLVHFAIAMRFLKARWVQAARSLFTGDERALLGKVQRVISTGQAGLLSHDPELLRVSECIEESRTAYQLIKGRERFDAKSSGCVGPRNNQCNVAGWNNFVTFFDFVSHGFPGPNAGSHSCRRHDAPDMESNYGIPF